MFQYNSTLDFNPKLISSMVKPLNLPLIRFKLYTNNNYDHFKLGKLKSSLNKSIDKNDKVLTENIEALNNKTNIENYLI